MNTLQSTREQNHEPLPVLPKLLTYKEAADILGLKPQTLRQWVSAKRIPFLKIGGTVRFTLEQINWFIENSRVE